MVWSHQFILYTGNIELFYDVIRVNFHVLPFQSFECKTGLIRVKMKYIIFITLDLSVKIKMFTRKSEQRLVLTQLTWM